MNVKIEGFEELADSLDELQENVGEIEGEHDIPIRELFPQSFMQTYTDCQSINEFFDNSPWEIESEDDFEAIPEEEFDTYVDDHSGFSDWNAMLSAAGREWISRQLEL